MEDSRVNTRYQRGHSAQNSGFKLATSTFALVILDVRNSSFIESDFNMQYSFVSKKQEIDK